ncbi:MAG TPA: DMT family transporter, partial [Polyangiaceae bacterium]
EGRAEGQLLSAARFRRSELLLVALAAAAAATSSPLAKVAHGLSFAQIGAGRCAVGAIVLLAMAPRATWRAVAGLDARGRIAVIGGGVLLGLHFALFLGGLLATSLPAAAALVSLEPLAVVLAAWVAFGARPNAREQVGIALATAGAAVVARGAGQGEHTLIGDALVLGAVAVYGVYVAFARWIGSAMPTTSYAACVFAIAACTLAVAVPFAPGDARIAPSGASWLAVLALGLVPTAVGHTLLQRASRRVPASIVALVSPGETLGSILIGASMGALPSTVEWLGALLVVVGASVAVLGARPSGRDARAP